MSSSAPSKASDTTSTKPSKPIQSSISTLPSTKGKARIAFPDRDVIEISDDEDEVEIIPHLPVKREPAASRPKLSQATHGVVPAQPLRSTQPSTPSGSSTAGTRKRVKKLVDFGDGEFVEYSTDEDDSARSSVPAPGPSQSVGASSNGTSSGATHMKKRKRYDFGDEVLYLSDDDDDAYPTMAPPSVSTPGFHLQKRVKVESGSGSTTYSSSIVPPPPSLLARQNNYSSGSMVKSEYQPSIPGAWPEYDPTQFTSSSQAYATAAGYAGAQAYTNPSTGASHLYAQSGFNMNYDDQTPEHFVDSGGLDHAEK